MYIFSQNRESLVRHRTCNPFWSSSADELLGQAGVFSSCASFHLDNPSIITTSKWVSFFLMPSLHPYYVHLGMSCCMLSCRHNRVDCEQCVMMFTEMKSSVFLNAQPVGNLNMMARSVSRSECVSNFGCTMRVNWLICRERLLFSQCSESTLPHHEWPARISCSAS